MRHDRRVTIQEDSVPYRLSLRTTRPPEAVLTDLESRDLAGVGVGEHGTHYLLLQDRHRRRYGADMAVFLGIGILLMVLIACAFRPLLILLLPLALAPALPLLIRRDRTLIAVSALPEADGVTRLTAHGEVTTELAGVLDAYFGALPVADDLVAPPGPPPARASISL